MIQRRIHFVTAVYCTVICVHLNPLIINQIFSSCHHGVISALLWVQQQFRPSMGMIRYCDAVIPCSRFSRIDFQFKFGLVPSSAGSLYSLPSLADARFATTAIKKKLISPCYIYRSLLPGEASERLRGLHPRVEVSCPPRSKSYCMFSRARGAESCQWDQALLLRGAVSFTRWLVR